MSGFPLSAVRTWMARAAACLIVVVASGLCGGPLSLSLQAQVSPPLELRLSETTGEVDARLGQILTTRGTARSLESGLPVRVRVVVELWRDRFFDSQEARFEWRATVRQDPLSNRFMVETGDGEQGFVISPAAAVSFLQGTLDVPIRPRPGARYYYLARIEVETLSLSDLDELRRWLQGDLGAAVEEGEQVGSAVGRGLRRLLVRALGLPVQRYQARTPTFEMPD